MKNIPGFVAEASLYQASRHYQTTGRSIGLCEQNIGGINTVMMADTDGPIRVYGCQPGYLQLGEGEDMVCVNPSDPYGIGGHDGGVPTSGGIGAGSGSGSGGRTKPAPAHCRSAENWSEIIGAQWRQNCSTNKTTCCLNKANQCQETCGSDSTCKNNCRVSQGVCADKHMPPTVCSL